MTAKEIQQNIASRFGIETLNPMQNEMIRSTAQSIILSAPTGSGKTIAFIIRLLLNLRPADGQIQAVVIAPSRELVLQISEVTRQLAAGYKTTALYGGHSMDDEKKSLTPMPDIIVATPGRLLDHIQRNHLEIRDLTTLVLDEYDKSLELGFEKEMRRIISHISNIGCLILTSATMLEDIPAFIPVKDPLRLDFTSSTANPHERMMIVEVESFSRDKLDTLVALLRSFPRGQRTIIFANHRESTERIYRRLIADHIPATLYHGALDQHQREMAIDLFTNGSAPVIVATNLAARGLDIADVANVVHYHLPVNEQTWIHRNGRTARIDREGTIWVIESEADSQPDYITPDRKYLPDPEAETDLRPDVASIYLSAGKKEKISRGDVAGFVSASGVTGSDEIGKIIVHDHHSVVAVPREKARETAKALNTIKLKGKKIRASVVH